MEVTKTAHGTDLGAHSYMRIKDDTQVADLLGWVDVAVADGHRRNRHFPEALPGDTW